MSTPLWVTTTRGASVGTATVTAPDTLTITGHGLVDGQQVTVAALAGGATALVEDAPYFVAAAATDTFQLRPAPGAPVMVFETDGGCQVYQTAGLFDPQTLRDAFSGLIARGGAAGGFQARPGVLPNGDEGAHVTTSGMNWTVADIVAVVQHSTGRMYLVPHATETGPVTAADPSQPRIDALDLRIQDTALDSSGFAQGEVIYTAGVPASIPTEPDPVGNAERLSTWRVEAGAGSTGEPTLPRFTGTRGGLVPVAGEDDYPADGYRGMPIWDASTETLLVNTDAGSTYTPVASTASFQSVRRVATSKRTMNSIGFASAVVIDSVTAPVEAGKTYHLKWIVDVSSTVAEDVARLYLREDSISGTVRQINHLRMAMANQDFGITVEADWTAAATGSKTFVATAERRLGTGTFSCNANANEPAYLTVEYVSG
ncbi:hypothetical protein [Glycomyces arizonensis]|uniref:hypothetical protein n=1 Tax=Glycomyces arizonensis TaxID=256035 RepID=UPI0004291FE1|nr:hypothetical protein [Glycomyces arizonensis]